MTLATAKSQLHTRMEAEVAMTQYVTINLDTKEESPPFDFMTLAILYGIVAGWANASTGPVKS